MAFIVIDDTDMNLFKRVCEENKKSGLKHQHMMLYCLIKGLAQSNGYCFATDEMFMERLDLQKSTVSKWLKILEDNGLIRRETRNKKDKNDNFYALRKIFITNPFEGYTTSVANPEGTSDGDIPHMRSTIYHECGKPDTTSVVSYNKDKKNINENLAADAASENQVKNYNWVPDPKWKRPKDDLVLMVNGCKAEQNLSVFEKWNRGEEHYTLEKALDLSESENWDTDFTLNWFYVVRKENGFELDGFLKGVTK